jgi:hypothetical protein
MTQNINSIYEDIEMEDHFINKRKNDLTSKQEDLILMRENE